VAEASASAPQGMDETALIAAIDDADNRAYGSNLSNLTAALSAERALNIDLYLGKNVDPAPEGQSNVIDRSVFETIQWILPSLCRIFANGDDVVSLVPMNEADVEGAKQEAAYLNWKVTQKHPWFELFLEWATDALLTKNAYFLVYRDRKRTVEIEDYEGQTKEGIAWLLQDPMCQLVDSRSYEAPDLPPEPVMDPQTGQPILNEIGQPMMRPAMLYDVTIRRRNEGKDLCIRVLPPERVKVDQRAYSWRLDERCNYFEYWEETTLTELREQGFDIPNDIADDPELYTQEDYARDQYGERRLERYKPSDPSMRRVKARMIWIRVDYDGDGQAELLQLLRVGRRILYSEEVSRFPVASGVACPLPHRHLGIAIADMVSDIQRIKTAILRQGLDNLYLSNNPQKVLDESKVNLDDALISRAGGVIRATDINAIRHEPTPFVFPQAVEGLQYMQEVTQNRTGVNNNFAGVDSGNLNNIQPGTVGQLSSMAAERVVQIARIMAFAIEDLFAIVHEQTLKMGHKRESIQIAGKWTEIDPGSWKKRTSFKIAVAFAAGNKDAQIGRLMAVLQKQVEALQLGLPVVTPENYYNTLMELTKAIDFMSPERFWTDPIKMPPKPPPPPPDAVQTAIINTQSKEKMLAAELIQRENESQRAAELEKYKIDSSAGLEIIHKQVDQGHTVAIEGLKASHAAILAGLDAKLGDVSRGTQKAVEGAQETIQTHTDHLANIHSTLNHVFEGVKKAGALAGARRVIRKGPKGDIEGVDLLDHEGNVLASHTAIKDQSGRITGMQ
jgi:hypothetical protein